MTMTDVRSPERSSAAGPSLVEALERPRYEILPLDGIADEVLEHLPAGRKITLTSSPSRGLEATLDLAEQLAPRGYEVVPHLAARLIADRAHLEEVVLRLRNAGVREAFVIAGDARQPAGEFEGAAELLSAMAGLPAGLAEVGISGYPESHHFISDETTIEAMFEKEPMASYIVSQICFDADVIRTWIRRVRERGTSLPIWIGVPGAVETRKLLANLAADRAGAVGPLPARAARPAAPLPGPAHLHAHRAAGRAGPFLRRAGRQGRRNPRIHLQRAQGDRDLAATARRPPEEPGGDPLTQVNEHPEILLYSRIRKSPYFYASRRHGIAMYSVYNHTLPPAALRRPGRGVLAPAERGDPVGRRRASARSRSAGRTRSSSPTCSSRAT